MNEMINNDGFAPVGAALVASSKLTTRVPTSVAPSVATDADSSEEKQAIALAQIISKRSIDSTAITVEMIMTADEARLLIKAEWH